MSLAWCAAGAEQLRGAVIHEGPEDAGDQPTPPPHPGAEASGDLPRMYAVAFSKCLFIDSESPRPPRPAELFIAADWSQRHYCAAEFMWQQHVCDV